VTAAVSTDTRVHRRENHPIRFVWIYVVIQFKQQLGTGFENVGIRCGKIKTLGANLNVGVGIFDNRMKCVVDFFDHLF
jgi:hypothetical protein